MRFCSKIGIATVGLAWVLGSAACSVTVEESPGGGGSLFPDAGPGGTDGAIGGGGSGGNLVDSGTGDSGGMADVTVTPADAGADADAMSLADRDAEASFCYGDQTVGVAPADAGALCATLPYAGQGCPGDPYPHTVAEDNCDFYAAHGRPGVFEAMFSRLYALSTVANACSREAVTYATREVANFSCTIANDSVTVDSGATWGCAQVVASCPWVDQGDAGAAADGGDAAADGGVGSVGPVGLAEWECRNWVDRFRSDHRARAFQCYAAQTVDPTTCRQQFADCLFNWQ